MMDFALDLCTTLLRLSTPLIFAAMAAVISRKVGVINLALESMMLVAALLGVLGSAAAHSAFWGCWAALAGGGAVGLLIGYFVIVLRADLYLTCIAVNLMASGGTVFLLYLFCGNKATSAMSLISYTLPTVVIPVIEHIPILGTLLSGHNIMTYLAFGSVFLLWFFLKRTRTGRHVIAVGENPKAAAAVGIPVQRLQILSFLLSGLLASVGGAYMSMGYVSWFSRDMVAGRGFIGMSAMNVSGAEPFKAMVAALVFGLFDTLSNTHQLNAIPSEFLLMFPYIATILSLAVTSWLKERRKRA